MRLRKRRDFTRVQRRGDRVVVRDLIAIHRPRPSSDPAGGHRFGLTVSRKVGNAVVRNRTKRRLREAIRRSARRVFDDSALAARDVVFIARPGAAGASYEDLFDQVATALARIREDVVSGSGTSPGGSRRRGSRRGPRSRR
jgi:ribonuclease P protein component